MMFVTKKTTVVIFLILGICISTFAQIDLSKYEIGLSTGVFVYQGDLTPQKLGSYKTLKPQFALHIYKILSPAFSIRFNFNKGKLYGNEALYANPTYRQQRNFNFSSPVTELSAHGVWNILANRSPRLSPYVFTGVGLSFLKIKRDWSNLNTSYFAEDVNFQTGLVEDASKTLPKIIPVIPLGVGVRYALNDKFSINTETNYRLTKTDYLDGFSKSANPNKKDHYSSHSVGVIYSFNKPFKGTQCPKRIL